MGEYVSYFCIVISVFDKTSFETIQASANSAGAVLLKIDVNRSTSCSEPITQHNNKHKNNYAAYGHEQQNTVFQ